VVGLALLGLGGRIPVGRKNNPFSLLSPLAALWPCCCWLSGGGDRPELIDGIGVRVLAGSIRRAACHQRPAEEVRENPRPTRVGEPERRELAVAFSWSFFNWVADVACLAFAATPPGATVSGRPDRRLAAARAVGLDPAHPGGLLVVRGRVVPGLVSSGMTLPDAISAMLIYRLVSWIFISLRSAGWCSSSCSARRSLDPDAVRRRLAVRRSAERPNRRRRPLRHRLQGRCRHPIQRPGPTTITDVSQRWL